MELSQKEREDRDRKDRDKWAWEKYDMSYQALCSTRKNIIDGLIEHDRKIKAATAVPKGMLDGKEGTATEAQVQARMQVGG